LCAVRSKEEDAGDGKRFMTTMPDDTYVRLSLTIGDKRIVALTSKIRNSGVSFCTKISR